MSESTTIAPTEIPVVNLLRIAFYAGDLLEELEECDATRADGISFEEILQAMLARAAERIRLRGFERGYFPAEEITARPRGRLLIAQSIAACVIPSRRLACAFDDFGVDTPHNRVLKACARTLSRCDTSEAHQSALRVLVREMREVSDVSLSRRVLHALPRSSATRRYRFVRFIARLIVDAGQPDESLGNEWARRLRNDPKKMRKVFEAFVRRWGRAHAPRGVTVGSSTLKWSSVKQERVGSLITDVTVRGADWTRIVECKYMRALLDRSEHHREMFHPDHLRQIFAYMMRTRDARDVSSRVDGVLLYPAFVEADEQSIDLGGFDVRVVRLALSAPWDELTTKLNAVLFDRAAAS